jgi:ribosomal protein S18 acetylase RimI-like enzyme
MKLINIREALPGDTDLLYELFSETDQMHRDAHPEIFREAKNPKHIKAYYLHCINHSDAVIFIAEMDAKIVGAIVCVLEVTSDIPVRVPRKYACIENITVSTKFRKQGIGNSLIEAAQAWAKHMGATMMELTVWEFNWGAKQFYKKQGYQATRSRMVKDL